MRLLVFAVVALLAPRTLLAQTIPGAEYAARRDSLAARLDSGIVVAFGAPAPTGFSRPTQLPAFRYLTGFLEPDAAAVLVARGGRMTGTLFLQARDPSRALYDGFPPDSSIVAQETGLSARSFSALRPMLDSLAGTGLPVYTLRDFSNSRLCPGGLADPGRELHAGLRLCAPRSRAPRRPSDSRQPSCPEESRGAGDASPRHRHHRWSAARGDADRAPRHVRVSGRGTLSIGLPANRRRRARVCLDRRLWAELHPIPLQRQRSPHGRRRCAGDGCGGGVWRVRRRRDAHGAGERNVHPRAARGVSDRA